MAAEQPQRYTPYPQADAETNPAVTEMSLPGKRHLWRRVRSVIALVLALAPVAGLAFTRSATEGEDPRSAYAQTTPNDVITRLQKRIDSGQVTLAYDSKRGYLPAALQALQVPLSSQMLVFSKTSVQKELISPEVPRALYFNDDVYIGYVPDSKAMEVVATDPQLGPVYYVLLQKQNAKPVFFRTVDACLECHAPKTSKFLPQHLLFSVYPNAEGTPDPNAKTYVTTDASPWNERWGGWYVTGRHGSQRHMGNAFAVRHGDEVTMDLDKGANLTDLHGLLDTSPYLTPHSDIVALMVFAHQTHLQNLITQANYQTRAALREAAETPKAANTPKTASEDARKPEDAKQIQSRIKEACEPLLQAMLFAGETPLKSPISGTSGFSEQFAARGPYDHKNRSLRELDLKHRLLRYPCSYTIYSEAFDALPDPAKDYLYRRLREVLRGQDQSKAFASLSAADRKAIWEILLETKPGFATRSHTVRR